MKWILEMLSEKGQPSSKRCAGFLIILVVLGCTLGMVLEEYESVKDLLEVEFIAGCSLIGMTTIANIFAKNSESQT